MKPVATTAQRPSANPLSDSPASRVLAALPHAVFVFDVQNLAHCVFENDAARALCLDAACFADGTQIAQALRRVAATGTTVTMQDVALGQGKPCLVSVSCSEEMVLLAVAPAFKVFEHGQDARDALRPAALMARTLAHEIKNPLAGIRGAAQLLSAQATDPVAAELPDLIVRETTRIARLVDDVMMFDSDHGIQKIPVNIHAPVEQALASLAAAASVEIQRQFDPSLPDIAADHDRLVQVVVNLLKNAVEAGATCLTVRSFYALSDTAPVDRHTHMRLPIALRIEDNGQGMDEETRLRLFEAYYTTKPGGQGLGLPIVAKIIHDLGGQIAVDSQPGKTLFTLYFPHPVRSGEVS